MRNVSDLFLSVMVRANVISAVNSGQLYFDSFRIKLQRCCSCVCIHAHTHTLAMSQQWRKEEESMKDCTARK